LGFKIFTPPPPLKKSWTLPDVALLITVATPIR
jgi:hypothetical protein